MSDLGPSLPRAKRERRLSSQVVSVMLHRIVSGVYPPNSLLPSEGELCQEFDVSRPVIREAVKNLENRDLLSVRQGDGTTVRPRSEWNLVDPQVLHLALSEDFGSRLVADVVDLRVSLELTVLREAQDRLTEEDFAIMARSLDVMSSQADVATLHEADFAFHNAFHRRSGNEICTTILRLLMHEMPQLPEYDRKVHELYRSSSDKHRDIYDALRKKDFPEAARRLEILIRRYWIADVFEREG